MLYIRLENFVPVEVSTQCPKCKGDGKVWAMKPEVPGQYDKMVNTGDGWMSRGDIGSFSYAFTLAALLTEKFKSEGRTFLASDAGPYTSPRFDVIEAPKVGDLVSKSFNGDTYPEGVITKITPKWQITTSTGVKFRRVKDSAGWRATGGTWWMTGGHHYEQNPHI
jgi:hypothetical protein